MNKSRRRGLDRWRQIISAQPTSGLNIAAYCRSQGISPPSFFAWRRRLADGVGPAFVEVTSADPIKPPEVRSHEAIEICLPGGRRLLARRGFDPALLVEVVRALEAIA